MAGDVHEWSVLVHRDNILNSNDRKHFQATKDPKRNLRTMGAIQQRTLPRMERVRIDVWVSFPPRSSPDQGNLYPTMKSYVDGMVHPEGKHNRDKGILIDDGPKFCDGPHMNWSGWGTDRPGWYLFRIRLTELEPWVKPPRPEYLS
ncbi:rusa-like resolvase [Arthrobacter phage Pureglobe5]|nr:RusA-like resolvase [Arthrobacter phage Odyssey395]UYL87414.1 rusa-like resolvase [Arthrobacter phage Pureglobe5]